MRSYQLAQYFLAATCLFSLVDTVKAQGPEGNSPLQATLTQSAESGKFTFVMFHRDNSEFTSRFYQQTQAALADFSNQTVLTTARVDDPVERQWVEKLGIARAPMPMTVVIAPNGATTGLFRQNITSNHVSAAIVSPTMMRCMKELQSQKLVFVCLTRDDQVVVPAGVQGVQQLPQFQGKIAYVGLRLDDPAENRFYQQMKLDTKQVNGPYAVLIAPPGALIGHFDAQASVEQVAAAIHKAGQCCDDESCNHNHAPGNKPR